MSGFNSRVTAFAIIILSLGFAAMDAAPALARAQLSPRTAVQRHVTEWRSNASLSFAPRVDTASCDLPSSGCPDNERITN